jgi:hypothetical protein
MENLESCDRYSELVTGNFEDVENFLRINRDKLETAELTLRNSAGKYIVGLRPTDEI